jgi:uncharacterized protein YneF (UPF0154 family)
MKKKKHIISIISIVSIVVFIGLVGLLVFFFLQYQHSQKLLQNPTEAAKEEIKTLVMEIGKSVVLPSKEDPTVATITDVNKLNAQPFFKQAQNGDKVIIYPISRKIILYRPSLQKIVDITAMNVSTSQPVTTPVVQVPAQVAVLNGTPITGLAAKTALQLEQKVSDMLITKKTTATELTYKKTIVAFSDMKYQKKAQEIAKLVQGEIGVLPTIEQVQGADIIVLLGR